MDIAKAIGEALALARIKGSAQIPVGEGAEVIARALANGAGFSVAVREGPSLPRPATEAEIRTAGFGYRGNTHVHSGLEDYLGAWAIWPQR